MGNSKIKISKKIVHRMYFEEKRNMRYIADFFGCTSKTISNRFKEWGFFARTTSEIMKQIPRTKDWCRKIGISNRGKKISLEARKKMSAGRLGKAPWNKGLRKATSPKLANAGHPGKTHWNWKGGISRKATRFRQTSEYKAWRDSVFRRDNFTCQFCSKHGGFLHAHHIIPLSIVLKCDEDLKNDLLLNPDNGWTACIKCHKEIHERRKK